MRRILTSLLFVASLSGSAIAADYTGGPVYGGWHAMPACDSPSVTWKVVEKFAYYDRHVIHSGLGVARIEGGHETASAVLPSRIDRRYCSATAWMSDGTRAEAVYLIEGPHLGTFNVGWHVESCVAGYDPWHVYDSVCRSIRP